VRRHAEIAGGGIGGLGFGIMLARRGWSVRIHERSPAIREVGAGISLRNNCITVLEKYGIFDRIRVHGSFLTREQHFDAKGTLLQQRVTTELRTMALPRQSLVDGLADVAREAGVEIVTSSQIIAADPAGVLINQEGRRFNADLVVGADGLRSRIRDSLEIGATVREFGTRLNRFLIDTREFVTEETKVEHWSGRRRVGIFPAGPGLSHFYNAMPARETAACRLPLDVEDWSRAYPRLEPVFTMLRKHEATQYPYSLVHCRTWHRGRAALIGDAAHGMPPTLGQGAGLTLLNGHALAEILSSNTDVPEALRRWEKAVRDISDKTQRWAVYYDRVTGSLPRALGGLRPHVIWTIGRFRPLYHGMRVADRGLPLIEMRLRSA
jgi:2-polyprenyl-6-methoxyphenol hydroxylase-like FAD-dependent oxidoreductase